MTDQIEDKNLTGDAKDADNSWHRWGPNDEAGALNLIGTEQVKRGASLVKTGQILQLAVPLSSKTPVAANRCGLQHLMMRDGGDYAAGARRPGGFQFAEDMVVMPVHIGTHVDALCHVWYDSKLFNGYPESSIRSNTGAAHLGAEKMSPAFTRGVLLDIVGLKGRALFTGEVIGREDLIAAAKQANVSIEKGDMVLIHTGWLASQKSWTLQGGVDFNEEPGINVEAARWLVEHGIAMVGADNFAIEALPSPPGTICPVHQYLIRDHGVPLLENVVLAELVATGRTEFLFVAAPLKLVGATGSPLTPLAIL